MKAVDPIRNMEQVAEFEERMEALGEREHILFLLGIYTGLRVSDLVKLRVRDVKNKTHIELVEQKTNKLKRISINPHLKKGLKKYIEDKNDSDYLIKSRQGKNRPLTRQRIHQILKRISDEMDMEKVACHSLRKTFGYHYYQKTKDVAFLQELYNHASPAITLRYIGTNQDLKDKAINNMDFRKRVY